MYEAFFGFRERPFPAIPSVPFYFPADTHEHAKGNVVRAVERAEGVALVIGSAGTGKSLICHLIADHFRQQFQIAMLSSARLCSRRALLQNILFELRLPYRDMEEGELRLSLIDHLEPSDRCANGMLLIVDEAHTLPLRLLEEIRMITNLVRGGQPRVRLVLAGDPQLEERLAVPRLASFQQRIAVRSYLGHLSQAETANYVRHQIQVAGRRGVCIFDDQSLVALHHATDGVPRLVNQVCDHALVLACAGGERRITARGVEEAWADLQQLPTPWNKSAADGERPHVIEFGPLSTAKSEEWSDFEEQFSTTTLSRDSQPIPEPANSIVFDVAEDETELDFETTEEQLELGDSDSLDETGSELDDMHRWAPAEAIATANGSDTGRAADPFGGEFADEEIVLDRFAIWDSDLRRRPRVSSVDGAQIAAALRTIADGPSQEPVEESLASTVQSLREEAQQVIASVSADGDERLERFIAAPQIIGGFDAWNENTWAAQVLTPRVDEGWLNDDRDLLIIEDGATPLTGDLGGRNMRHGVRNIFLQLRGDTD